MGRILLVDDEHLVGMALSHVLYREYEVVAVTHATEALERLNAGERFDIVLCDLRMPVMDGIEFHEQLSLTLPEEADRIVFITGGELSPRAEAFFRRVHNLLMTKPLDLDGVRQLIERRYRAAPAVETSGKKK